MHTVEQSLRTEKSVHRRACWGVHEVSHRITCSPRPPTRTPHNTARNNGRHRSASSRCQSCELTRAHAVRFLARRSLVDDHSAALLFFGRRAGAPAPSLPLSLSVCFSFMKQRGSNSWFHGHSFRCFPYHLLLALRTCQNIARDVCTGTVYYTVHRSTGRDRLQYVDVRYHISGTNFQAELHHTLRRMNRTCNQTRHL